MIGKIRNLLSMFLVVTFMLSSTFTVHAAPPVTITSPSVGQTYFQGNRVTLSANISGATWAQLRVESPTKSIVFQYDQNQTGLSSIRQDWTIPNGTVGEHTLIATGWDASGGKTERTITFTIKSSQHTGIDAAAVNDYFVKQPVTYNDYENGAVIQSNGALGTIQTGEKDNVIRIILEGVGVYTYDRYKYLYDLSTRYQGSASMPNYTRFYEELEPYLIKEGILDQVRKHTIKGIVHRHPNGSPFSTPDKYLAAFLNIPIYVATNDRWSDTAPCFDKFYKWQYYNDNSWATNGTYIAYK